MENIPIAEPITTPLINNPECNTSEFKYCRQCNQLYKVIPSKLSTAQYYRCKTCSTNLLYKSLINSCQIM